MQWSWIAFSPPSIQLELEMEFGRPELVFRERERELMAIGKQERLLGRFASVDKFKVNLVGLRLRPSPPGINFGFFIQTKPASGF
jgi:hypothetical protein